MKGPLTAILAAGALAAAPAAASAQVTVFPTPGTKHDRPATQALLARARGNQLRATVTLAGPEGTATATVALARFS